MNPASIAETRKTSTQPGMPLCGTETMKKRGDSATSPNSGQRQRAVATQAAAPLRSRHCWHGVENPLLQWIEQARFLALFSGLSFTIGVEEQE